MFLENEFLRVEVVSAGGHISAIIDKQSGVNPLWTPVWYGVPGADCGKGNDAGLLSKIVGHNLCLDIFGVPSEAEHKAGYSVHGEASVVDYDIASDGDGITMRTVLPMAQIRFERTLRLHGRAVCIGETVESLLPFDRPIGWTQHATLGPPFLENGVTQFRASATRSKVFEGNVGGNDYLPPGAEFDWPIAPGGIDLSVMNPAPKSSAFTTHQMDPLQENAFFVAWSPKSRLAFGYIWKRADFPWLGIWEENHSRTHKPWDGRSLTRGMEFGVSPFPEGREAMVKRGSLFGAPAYGWLPANGTLRAEYWATLHPAEAIPEALSWPAR